MLKNFEGDKGTWGAMSYAHSILFPELNINRMAPKKLWLVQKSLIRQIGCGYGYGDLKLVLCQI